MVDRKKHYLYIILCVLVINTAQANIRSIDLLTGYVYNIPSLLLITQEGRTNLLHNASYETRSLNDIPYFVLRLNFKVGSGIIEAQWMHHKIHLSNTTGDIRHFEISDGFNILSINYRLMTKYLDYRFGLGAAITYCKSTIRGFDYTSSGGLLNSGYFIAGPVLLLGVNKEFDLSSSFYVNVESQFTASWALVTIAGGYAYVSNFATHLMLGLGYRF